MGQCPNCPRLIGYGATAAHSSCCLDAQDRQHVIAVGAERDALLEADRLDSMMLRIPGRRAEIGEVTHKLPKDMNRKERRAFQSSRRR